MSNSYKKSQYGNQYIITQLTYRILGWILQETSLTRVAMCSPHCSHTLGLDCHTALQTQPAVVTSILKVNTIFVWWCGHVNTKC